MKRQCMYCGTPISECFGYVIPRDILPILEAVLEDQKYEGPQPPELCSSFKCNNLWAEQVQREIENEQTSTDPKC